ncbi:MAG: hypothetical protein NTX48_21255 [Planctomycetales bacterium]|nr:hypothetical protein [Planctomycetales bacterium]
MARHTWQIDRVATAPRLEPEHRQILKRHDIIPQDLADLTEGLERIRVAKKFLIQRAV